jgi:superfamily I DNA and/or RNA helicase
MLHRDVESTCTSSVTGTAVDVSWRDRFFRYFDHLMQSTATSSRVATNVTLDEQHRMHPDIGEMVGRTFYPKGLRHHPDTRRPHGLSLCGRKLETSLLWVDTSGFGQRAWENDQEGLTNLTERRLVAWLVGRGIQPRPYDPRTPPLAILSPYKRQVQALSENVKSVERDVVRTVDSVQGREADVVIVSLARNNSHSDARAALGFLEEPERVNVMFSRARRLLVIVGSLKHFERQGVDHWEEIAHYVRSEPRFLVDAGELGFRAEGT